MDENVKINPLTKYERFKIFEYFEYSVIQPNDGRYDFCFVFFAGFNENASKYIYLFKLFLENFDVELKIKIILPMLNRYTKEDYKDAIIPRGNKANNLYSWYVIRQDTSDQNKIVFIRNEEKDNLVKSLIYEEIKKLGSSEKIILGGFSMGGRYLLMLLTEMKIKTKFNLLMKVYVYHYENPYFSSKLNDDVIFNSNNFHCLYSKYDKIVGFDLIFKSYQLMKKNFENIHLLIDNSKKHVVDFLCLEYLKKLFYQYLLNKEKF